MTHGRGCRSARAFTLIELVTSMGIMLVLMGGIGSAFMLASRAVPAADGVFHHSGDAATSVQQIVGELYTATGFTEWDQRAVTFTVHDRDNDTIPEIIRYAWSGVPGAPITYSFNGSLPKPFAADVHAFQLAYGMEKVDKAPAPDPNESVETLLISHDATKDLSDADVKSDKGVGQYFLPLFSPGISSWSVTRVKFKAAPHSGTDGVVRVRLQTPNAQSRPSGTVLEEHTALEVNFDVAIWQEVTFSNVSGLSPTQGLCLTIEYVSGAGTVAKVRYHGKNLEPNAFLLKYENSAWSSRTGDALLYEVYGTTTSLAPSEIFPVYSVRDVHLAIQVGPDPAARLETTVQILNQPEVTEGALAIY